ncbi:PH domain-containing protein (plasmid) [Halarchaeum sp. CBA1220]|uniref:PH domain-containing protein n=1 Tax=Halarchaeum sp. CBA1220 TaxID=1853682 RepID=UPI000F3A928A|nr:PH domain-containing protein [Halarchaeum sp. CBA1220]QLC35010.1 PH domain-containing protein [Halarchaeum sp. CBA1220]
MAEHGTLDPETLDWLTLDADESVVWAGKPHESSLIPALVVGVPLSLVLVGLLVIAGAYLNRENTQYVVTTDALYRKSGVLSRDVQRIDFGKVQNTSYSQGFFGSRFGYGTVDVSTAGGSGVEMRFQSVPDPRAVQERINERVKAARGERAGEDEETAADVLDDVRDELRAIRRALEARDGDVSDGEHEGDTSGGDADVSEADGDGMAPTSADADGTER